MKRALLIALFLCPFLGRGQSLVTVSGAEVSISPGADVFIDGSLTVQDNSDVFLNGLITITGNAENLGALNQQGELALFGNWINNGTYLASDVSVFRLTGVNQSLGGDSLSHFGILNCENAGIKELGNSMTCFQMNLANSILQTQQFSALVRDADVSSLSFSEGRVMSAFNGQIRRNINASGLYVFPVGDANARWQVEYQSAGIGQLGVRYAPVDANLEGLSRFQVVPELCGLSDAAYIQVNDLPSPSGDLKLSFPASINDQFPTLCIRETGLAQPWSIAASGSAQINADTAVFTSASNMSNPAFILGRRRPQTPQISGESVLCQLSGSSSYSVDSAEGNRLIWTISGGTLTNQTAESILVDWSDAFTGLVSVVSTDATGCSSLPGNLPVVLNPLPVANIGVVNPALPFENTYFNFYSTESSNAYSWQFEDGQTYTDSSIFHSFQIPGIYTAILLVENDFGCTDTAHVSVQVLEGLVISNVITPNGDGINDYFELPNSGIVTYQLSIFNRWGVSVFESSEPNISWDGRDASGNTVSPGTYFYVLQANSSLTDYSKRGSIQVIY